MPDGEFTDTVDVVWQDTSEVLWEKAEMSLGGGLGLEDSDRVYSNALSVTPDDSNDLTKSGLIYVGTGGNIKVDFINFGTVTILNVPSGRFIQSRVKKVYATGTTASDLVVIF